MKSRFEICDFVFSLPAEDILDFSAATSLIHWLLIMTDSILKVSVMAGSILNQGCEIKKSLFIGSQFPRAVSNFW